ncbi:MAG: GTPase HflX [Armatimonadetes bacterium]|nr:GTPase HflX [Armatimonadota bacterium]
MRRRVPQDRIANPDLLEILSHLAQALRREVGVFVDRHGVVGHVVVSRRWQPLVEEVSHRSGRPGAGLRYLEAHPDPDGRPDEGDRQILEQLGLDLVVTVGTHRAQPTEVWLLGPAAPASRDGQAAPTEEGPYNLSALAHLELAPRVRMAEAARRRRDAAATPQTQPERAVLVALDRSGDAERSLDELARLAETAGALPVTRIIQRRARPNPATYLGRGKVEEVVRATETYAASLVIIDDDLTPAQQRTLEREIGVKVLDRTALVLDIFAQRARSREGRLQVELAQMTYLLPRLTGRGVWLSRLGGGIGTRGPGETKLEVDRRRIRKRITDLQGEIDAIAARRSRQRLPRGSAGIPQVALVGYTNAGKSALLNALTGADAFVENRLFATLDPTVRRLVLPNRREIVLADTVGFIQRLPTELVAAFRATLEEVTSADLLLHVIDASHPDWAIQADVVRGVLEDIGAGDHPVLPVFNKADLLSPHEVRALAAGHPDAVVISAAQEFGLERLQRAIMHRLPEPWIRVRLQIPYSDAKLLARVHSAGRVLDEQYGPDGVTILAELPGTLAVRLRTPGRPGAAASV